MIRRTSLLFLIPFMLLVGVFLLLGQLNRSSLHSAYEGLALAQGDALRQVVERTGHFLAGQDESRLTDLLDAVAQNEAVVYVGLFCSGKLIHLNARYEGYFPVGSGFGEPLRILRSPVGTILDIQSTFRNVRGEPMRLNMGFSYQFLDQFTQAAHRHVLMLLALFALTAVLVLSLLAHLERRRFQTHLALENSLQERDRFRELSLLTAEIAHEVRNPLNAIYLSFNALEPYLEDPDARFYREAIRGEIRRVNGIISAYSDLGREVVPRKDALHLEPVLRSLVWMMNQEGGGQGMSIVLQVAGDPVVQTDEDLLRQILVNLIRNARQAGASRLVMRVEPGEGKVVLAVEDNGHGISSEVAGDLFVPFRSLKPGGMGLGLHLSRRLAQALGGRLELVESRAGKTLFHLDIQT